MSESLIVVLHLLLALSVSYFCGYGIVKLCGKGQSMMPVVGYASSQLMFFLFYFIFFDANMAVAAVLVVAVVLNAASLWFVVASPTGRQAGYREFLIFAAAGIGILLIAAWPYFLAGSGNYWHSGNEDVFDANNGRDAYVHKEVALQEYWEQMNKYAARGDISKYGFSGKSGESNAVVRESTNERLVDVYASDLGRLQYSSTAFWSVVLGAKHGMDAWLIQALLNLLLMGYGLALLLRKALPIGQATAGIMATAAVANHFYLTTYFNGHQGSLMFAAMIPYGLLLALDMLRREQLWFERVQSGIILIILLLFVVGAYPYPLPFFILAILIYWFIKRFGEGLLRRRYLIGFLLFLLGASYFGLWVLFEPIRERALGQFRSWGPILNYMGFFQFWGIWPSMLASASLGFMNPIINSGRYILASYFAGAGLCGLTVFGLYRAAKMGSFLFVAFAVMWLTLFPFMRFIVGDSYYFYKFLYLNNFFIVALMIFGYLQVKVGGFPRVFTIAAGGFVGIWVVLNLANNIWATGVISARPFNAQIAEFRALVPVFQSSSKNIYIDLPRRGMNGTQLDDYEGVIRNYLWDAGIQYNRDKSTAKYLLRMNGNDAEDIIERSQEKVLWKSSLFRLIEAPAANLLTVGAFWAPEGDQNTFKSKRDGRFRWVSDGAINGFFSVGIVRPNEDVRFLHFCAETGPGVDYRPITLLGRDGKGNDLVETMVENFGCYWINLEERQGPFRFFSEVTGHAIPPLEMRHLNFRVFNIGVSRSSYDLTTLRYLNEPDDITPQATALALSTLQYPKDGTVYLANGWYGLERQGDAAFRWVHSGAQLVVDNCPGVVSLDVEPGPSLGRMPLNLLVRTTSGRIVGESRVEERSVIEFSVDSSVTGDHVLELVVAESEGLKVPGDPRRLDFRVFSVAWNRIPGDVGYCSR